MLIEFGRFQSKYQCQQNEEQECMGGYGIPIQVGERCRKSIIP